MAYTEITKHNSPNYTPDWQVPSIYGMNRTIEGITIHWWGDPNQNPSFEGIVSWLCRANGSSSCHPVATGTGSRVAWLVDAQHAAWHAGSARGNATTIGIECDPRARNEDYNVVAELIADIWIAYNRRLPLIPHRNWMSTACPGVYDLGRLQREAEAWYSKKIAPTPQPEKPKWVKMDNPRFMRAATDLSVIDLDKNQPIGSIIKAGTDIDFRTKKEQNGTTYIRSAYSTTKNLNQGIDIRSLKEIPAPTPPKPEWIVNLKDITDTKLIVLPAAGVKVIHLETLQPVNDTIIPKGTWVDIAKETTVKGQKYYISNFAVNSNAANGILASSLGIPANPPKEEKPEWLQNLQDIEDKDFWCRGETSVLNLENGKTVRYLKINDKVRITHATSIVDINLLVLEGQKEGIQTIYLSDKPIENPNDDLEKRVTALEKLVKAIVEFLTSIFKNFRT